MDYEKKLSTAAQTIKPSGIRKFFDLANQMEGVISLGVGNLILRHLGRLEKLQSIQLKKDVLSIPQTEVY